MNNYWLFSDFLTLSSNKQGQKNIPLFSVTDTGIYPRKDKFKAEIGKNLTKNKIIKKNNIVFGMSRKILNFGVMKEDIGSVSPAYLIYEVDETKINPIYLEHYIRINDNYFKNIIKPGVREGRTIDKEVLLNKKVKKISLYEQQKIVDFLSVLDNKIELNNQINKDLEELVQTLYTKWFVNFDFPNEEGKPYKSSGGEMIDSELGEIPMGWSVGELGGLMNFTNGFAFKSNTYSEKGKYRVITIKNVLSNMLSISENDSKIVDKPNSLKLEQELNIGDILMSLTGEVGRVCLVDVENCLLNQRVCKINPNKDFYYSYVFNMLLTTKAKSKITGIATGSIQQNVSTSKILELKNIIPNEKILKLFDIEVRSTIELYLKNNIQNQQLKETRDLLLPYLMSGKINLN